jgi:hypothetical protein
MIQEISVESSSFPRKRESAGSKTSAASPCSSRGQALDPRFRACEGIPRHASARLPAESRGPLLRGTNLSSMGQALRLLGKLGAVEGWVPAGPTDPVRGLKAHGKTSNGLRRRETRAPFLHALEARGPFLRSANGSRSTRCCHCLKVQSSGATGPGLPHGTNPWADGPREDEARFAHRDFDPPFDF